MISSCPQVPYSNIFIVSSQFIDIFFFRALNKKFAVTLSETTATFNEKMAKLQRHLEMKDELNKKWSVETKDIVKNLETFIGQLKKELRMLRKENSKLRSELEYEKKKFEQYKYFLKIIASDVDHSNGVVQENVGTAVWYGAWSRETDSNAISQWMECQLYKRSSFSMW